MGASIFLGIFDLIPNVEYAFGLPQLTRVFDVPFDYLAMPLGQLRYTRSDQFFI
jgi:hypothetical protein